MGTSMGRATDRLIALCSNGFDGTDVSGNPMTSIHGGIPAPVPALSSIEANVNVADVSATADTGVWVIIGRSGLEADAEIAGSAQYQVLGLQRINESYTIPVMILLLGDGPTWVELRNRALALFDGVVKLAAADPTLGLVLEQGRIAMVSSFNLKQYDPTTEDAHSSGAAVGAEISFDLQVENSYVP